MEISDSAVTLSPKLSLPIALSLFIIVSGCDSSSVAVISEDDSQIVGSEVSNAPDDGAESNIDTDGETNADSEQIAKPDPDTRPEAGSAANTNPIAGAETDTETGASVDDSTNATDTTKDLAPNDAPVDYISIHTGANIPANRVLAKLPSSPLTPHPGNDSEPVIAPLRTSTITEFSYVEDPVRDLMDREGQLTEADFAAGALPAIISTPADVDPLTNLPPFFVGLANAEVFAGEELIVRYDPDDPEGGLPGLFGGPTPGRARFPDNYDTTRSLVWRPLQPEVGIHEFTATAIDPENQWYRSTQTIRIKVKLPADQSGIENLPPVINQIRPHTVRANDPVVAYIKATDPNGTIPTLQVLNPPAGLSTSKYANDETTTILHFVPEVAGQMTIKLRAIDAVDTSLSSEIDMSIEVLSEADFIRPGSRLRDLAEQHDLLIGYAVLASYFARPDGAVYADIASEEFNIVSTENSLKFDTINPVPGKYSWSATDNLVQQAKAANQVIMGHTLVWHNQLPAWAKRSAPANRELIMREHIDRVLSRYSEDILFWDVVNEALEDDGTYRNSIWYEGMGASYIDIAFRQARLSAPTANLIYNDYDISYAGPKFDAMLVMLQQLKDAGTPLDGVGFQMHLLADFNKFDELASNFQKIADLDLDIHVTELDVSVSDDQTLDQQAVLFEKTLSACLAQPRCKTFQTWGYTDQYSWRRDFKPLMLDERYQVKPAYLALQQRLSEN